MQSLRVFFFFFLNVNFIKAGQEFNSRVPKMEELRAYEESN